MPSIRINYDEDAIMRNVDEAIRQKMEKGLTIEAKREIAGEYAAAVYKYVPKGPDYKGHRGGMLSDSATIVDNGEDVEIRYSAHSPTGKKKDYAAVQYNAPDWWDRHTPDTYSHWNRHLSRGERLAFYEAVARIVEERMNG